MGVTSGASVPEVLVRGVLDYLAERGWESVEEITTAEETLTFSLPRELRPERARAARSWPGGRSGGRPERRCGPASRPAGVGSALHGDPGHADGEHGPLAHAIIGNALTSGAPITSSRSAMPGAGLGGAGEQHHHRHGDGHQQRAARPSARTARRGAPTPRASTHPAT